ncbi:HNH endonuclease signature motif containing protein, partial [Parafrigoribacterium mesophilum]
TRRLFDDRQHEALAIRDGGCLWPDCGQPPLMTEAHHTNEYDRDHGNTDIADGVCLCRFHHLTLHNNGWRITRVGSNYWLIPPPGLDPEQTPIPLQSKSLLIRKLRQSRRSSSVETSHGLDHRSTR